MRVIHVFKDFYPPTVGGIEQHMYLLCRTMARDVDTIVLVPSRSRKTIQERIDGIRVIRVPEFGRYASAPLCPTLPLWLRRLRPDIVHVHFPNPMGDLGYLASGVSAPLVVSYHADIVKQRRLLPFYRPVLDVFFRKAARVIAASQEYIDSSVLLSAFRDKTVVIPYGVDTRRVSLREEEVPRVAAVRRDYGDRLLVFVGVLRYYKGLDVLLRALRSVDAHAIIVGRGTDESRLRDYASRLGVAQRVTFAGEVDDSQLRVLLHAADLFTLPSIDRCEAFGIAQLEAMACGVPVVSSDLPTGVRMVNVDGLTGLRVAPGDPDALATAINRLFNDDVLRRRLGNAARDRVAREFTAEMMTAKVREVYSAVVPAARPAIRASGIVS